MTSDSIHTLWGVVFLIFNFFFLFLKKTLYLHCDFIFNILISPLLLLFIHGPMCTTIQREEFAGGYSGMTRELPSSQPHCLHNLRIINIPAPMVKGDHPPNGINPRNPQVREAEVDSQPVRMTQLGEYTEG